MDQAGLKLMMSASFALPILELKALWTRMAPVGSYIWMLGPQLVDYLGRIRRYDLVGGSVSLGLSFEVSKAHSILSWLSASTIAQHHACRLLPPAMVVMDSPFVTVSNNKVFIL